MVGNNVDGPMLPPGGDVAVAKRAGGAKPPLGDDSDSDSTRAKCRVDVAFVEI